MKEYLLALSSAILSAIKNLQDVAKRKKITGYADNGDAQFSIDKIAENVIRDFIHKNEVSVVLKTEDGLCEKIGKNPHYLLLIDPIDGSRPAAANLEMATISIAVAPYTEGVIINDIEYALIREIKNNAYLYADINSPFVEAHGYNSTIPCLSQNTRIDKMFWSFEFNGHPTQLMINAYGHLIDQSANTGGIFIFNSASFSITRVITGQLDAYVDIGNRLLKDNLALLPQFKKVGNGKVLHLFPYDIAASVFIAKKCGAIITDAYGRDLGETYLLDSHYLNQQSCIAASNKVLHTNILENIKWDIKRAR